MDREQDLAALFSKVTRRLIDAETPILQSHDVSMWEYSVLYRLARREAETQAALAHAIGYDKTRLIRVLDSLQERGLIERQRGPADRRAHLVRLTKAGSTRFTAVQADIRKMEKRVLQDLGTTDDARALVAGLHRLAGAV